MSATDELAGIARAVTEATSTLAEAGRALVNFRDAHPSHRPAALGDVSMELSKSLVHATIASTSLRKVSR